MQKFDVSYTQVVGKNATSSSLDYKIQSAGEMFKFLSRGYA